MRSEEDGTERAVASGADGKDVPGGIDTRREPDVAHERHHVLTSGDVGVGVGDAADAVRERASCWTPERAEGLELLPQPGSVDARRRRLRTQGSRGKHRRGADRMEKVASVHPGDSTPFSVLDPCVLSVLASVRA